MNHGGNEAVLDGISLMATVVTDDEVKCDSAVVVMDQMPWIGRCVLDEQVYDVRIPHAATLLDAYRLFSSGAQLIPSEKQAPYRVGVIALAPDADLSGDATATWSIDDDMLRVSFAHRVDAGLFRAFRENGFRWLKRTQEFEAKWGYGRLYLIHALSIPFEEEEMTSAERAESKIEAYDKIAANAARESDAAFDASIRISERFANGQPILVGHHSEAGARAAQTRMHAKMEQSHMAYKRKEKWELRASSVAAKQRRRASPLGLFKRKQEAEALVAAARMRFDVAMRPWAEERNRVELAHAEALLDYVTALYAGVEPPAAAEDLKPGDWVRAIGQWYLVKKASAKSVRCYWLTMLNTAGETRVDRLSISESMSAEQFAISHAVTRERFRLAGAPLEA